MGNKRLIILLKTNGAFLSNISLNIIPQLNQSDVKDNKNMANKVNGL